MRLTQILAGLGMVILGAAIALLVKPGGKVKPFQVTGDPPVTVSDGSLHAHSSAGWVSDQADGDATIQPLPRTGSIHNDKCGMVDKHGKPTGASLWAEDQIYDITPPATVTIVFDSANAPHNPHAAEVTINVPADASPLTIATADGKFHKAKGDRNNRMHSRPGDVESISISNPADTWKPSNKHNPHFTLLFCYQ